MTPGVPPGTGRSRPIGAAAVADTRAAGPRGRRGSPAAAHRPGQAGRSAPGPWSVPAADPCALGFVRSLTSAPLVR